MSRPEGLWQSSGGLAEDTFSWCVQPYDRRLCERWRSNEHEGLYRPHMPVINVIIAIVSLYSRTQAYSNTFLKGIFTTGIWPSTYHLVLLSQSFSLLQNRALQVISSLDVQRQNGSYPTEVSGSTRDRRYDVVEDVNVIVRDSRDQVSKAERVQRHRAQPGSGTCDHRCAEEAQVLEAIGLSCFGSRDATFGLRVQGFMIGDMADEVARL